MLTYLPSLALEKERYTLTLLSSVPFSSPLTWDFATRSVVLAFSVETNKRKKDTLRESFATFDQSGEGLVSVSALVEILEHAGITDIEPEEVRAWIIFFG